MGFDDVVTAGLVALFGGALAWAAIGALVGRFQGFQVGIATGMILFGLTGLVVAGWLAWLLWAPGADAALSPEQIGLVGVFGAFGGFGALGGGVILASELERRHPRPPKPVSAARAHLATAFTVSGNLVLVGGVVIGLVLDDDVTRGTFDIFRSIAIACACWFVASVLGQGLKLASALFFLLLGGGFYLAAQSLRLFGGLGST